MKKIFIFFCLFLIGCAVQQTPGSSEPKPLPECQTDKDCIKGGCSGTICQSKDVPPIITTCEWKEEYTCYQESNCICMNNKCEWDDQPTLESCINSYK